VIVVAVRWYPRFGLSYRDVEELLLERGIEVGHVTVYRWVQRFTPLLLEVWRYVYRAIDQYGQVIDVRAPARRDAGAARRHFTRRCPR